MIKKKDWNTNNKFYKRYIQDMKNYFDIVPSFVEKVETSTKKDLKEYASNLPTLQGFLSKIKVDRDIFSLWMKQAFDDSYCEKDKIYKIELFNTYKKCREISEHIWINNSLKWLYSSTFAWFVGKNIFWWKDKIDNEKEKNDLENKREYLEQLESRINSMKQEEIDRVIIEILK